MSVESVMPSTHLILCRPLHLLPSVFPSIIHATNEKGQGTAWPSGSLQFWGKASASQAMMLISASVEKPECCVGALCKDTHGVRASGLEGTDTQPKA